jgi:hypothetical protein
MATYSEEEWQKDRHRKAFQKYSEEYMREQERKRNQDRFTTLDKK